MVTTIDSQWLKNELLDEQRWEDEGGQLIRNIPPPSDGLPVPRTSINVAEHHASLEWNERLVIEPFHPGNRVFWITKNLHEHRL
jgi:hypothetical protein